MRNSEVYSSHQQKQINSKDELKTSCWFKRTASQREGHNSFQTKDLKFLSTQTKHQIENVGSLKPICIIRIQSKKDYSSIAIMEEYEKQVRSILLKKFEYAKNIKELNIAFLDWIKANLDENPLCDLSPVFRDYEQFIKDFKKGKNERMRDM